MISTRMWNYGSQLR